MNKLLSKQFFVVAGSGSEKLHFRFSTAEPWGKPLSLRYISAYFSRLFISQDDENLMNFWRNILDSFYFTSSGNLKVWRQIRWMSFVFKAFGELTKRGEMRERYKIKWKFPAQSVSYKIASPDLSDVAVKMVKTWFWLEITIMVLIKRWDISLDCFSGRYFQFDYATWHSTSNNLLPQLFKMKV